MSKQSAIRVTSSKYEEDRISTAAYIADLLEELRLLAEKQEIAPLNKLLQIAREEAAKAAGEA